MILFLAFAAGMLNGLLGTGGGILALPLMNRILGDRKKAHGTVLLFILPMSLLSIALYTGKVFVPPQSTLLLCIGSLVGGAVGALLLKKLSGSVLRLLFGVIIVVSGVRILF